MRISLVSLLIFGDRAFGLVAKRFPSSLYQLKESHYVSKSWSKVGAAPPDHIIRLRIGLAQGRFDELEKNLYEGKKIITKLSRSDTRRLGVSIFVIRSLQYQLLKLCSVGP